MRSLNTKLPTELHVSSAECGLKARGASADQGIEMLEQEPERVEFGSVRDDQAHFQHRLEVCDTSLRRLTQLSPIPLDAVEALLEARQVAEQRLTNGRLQARSD